MSDAAAQAAAIRSDIARAAPRYPAGTLRALLETDHVSVATRAALLARLAASPASSPRYFDVDTFALLGAVCARLVPTVGDDVSDLVVDVAGMIDERLAAGMGDGWRYAVMPPDGLAYRLGLHALDAHARATCGRGFGALDAAEQDAVLTAVQRGAVSGEGWARVPPRRFFEELLAEATEATYSHPLVQEAIGYAGMADRPAWRHVGLDELEPREPRAVHPTDE